MAWIEKSAAVMTANLSKRFGANAALHGISLCLAQGCSHALLGPNASGKTTLLRILAGLIRPDSGTVQVLPGRIGYVPQRFCYYDELTARENLRFVARMNVQGDPIKAADLALQEFDLQNVSERRAQALSGGQRQRLMLAAALMHRPALLLLDEPTTALDSASREALWRRLERLTAAGMTCVLTTHETADADRCESCSMLGDGQLLRHSVTRRV